MKPAFETPGKLNSTLILVLLVKQNTKLFGIFLLNVHDTEKGTFHRELKLNGANV